MAHEMVNHMVARLRSQAWNQVWQHVSLPVSTQVAQQMEVDTQGVVALGEMVKWEVTDQVVMRVSEQLRQ